LKTALNPNTVPPADTFREPQNIMLGRIGESIYQKLFLDSRHEAAVHPRAHYDFQDVDGNKVNVRVRRLNIKGRWTFFRSPHEEVDHYFFIGMDTDGSEVQAFFRVPANEMPPQGFSYRPGAVSRWDKFKLSYVLPVQVSSFIDITEIETLQLEVTGLSITSSVGRSPVDEDALATRCLQYHRFLGFPYVKVPPDRQVLQDLRALQKYQPDGIRCPSCKAGLEICSAYMPHRFKARNCNADFSALDAFFNDTRLLKAVKMCLKSSNGTVTQANLRSALSAINRTPSQFRPAVAKGLVEAFCTIGGTVFDPCAGWGGRMLGTLAVGRRYVGIDRNPETAVALSHLGGRLCELFKIDSSYVEIQQKSFQDVPDGEVRADFAMTSPPYLNREIYPGDPEFDITVDVWVSEFLLPMFMTVASMLLPGGHFAVNIANLQNRTGGIIPLEDITIKAGLVTGFSLATKWQMQKGSFGKQQAILYEPIYIFRKEI